MSRQYPNGHRAKVAMVLDTIRRGRETDRAFDSCFEDGEANNNAVGAAVYAVALRDPALMAKLPRYLIVDILRRNYDEANALPLFAGEPAQ